MVYHVCKAQNFLLQSASCDVIGDIKNGVFNVFPERNIQARSMLCLLSRRHSRAKHPKILLTEDIKVNSREDLMASCGIVNNLCSGKHAQSKRQIECTYIRCRLSFPERHQFPSFHDFKRRDNLFRDSDPSKKSSCVSRAHLKKRLL